MRRERQVNQRLQAWIDDLPEVREPLLDDVRTLVSRPIVRTSDGFQIFAGSKVALKNANHEILYNNTGIEASVNSVHIDVYGENGSVPTYTSQLLEAVDLIADSIQKAGFPGTYCTIGNVNNSEFPSSTVRFHRLRPDESAWIGDLDGFQDSEGVLLETITIP